MEQRVQPPAGTLRIVHKYPYLYTIPLDMEAVTGECDYG